MNQLSLFIVLCCISGYHGFLNPYPKIRSIPSYGDVEDPLFLTPYIEEGKIKEGQDAAMVRLPGSNITSFSGYLTVNKTFNSNLFFWFFPSESDPKNAPVVLWLQGGPGVSSLFGLFRENGPFFIDKEMVLKERQYYWSRQFNVIYIDNPVGTGFSFTCKEVGYVDNEVAVGNQLYNALLQFFQLFPELEKNEFFISGESYAGKYVPAIGYTIHINNDNGQKINLKGLAIGNGWTDPENMMVYADYLYQLGLVDSKTRTIIRRKEYDIVEYIKNHQYVLAKNSWDEIFHELDSHINIYNYLQNHPFSLEGEHSVYLQTPDVRKSIHVGNLTYNNGSIVQRFLNDDIMQSVKRWVEVLVDNYRVMFYSGQLDISVAYPLTVNFLTKLNWNGSYYYETAPRKAWMVGDELAGFYKSAKGLTEVLVRGAGHMVPQDQPKRAFDLITRFIQNRFR